MENPFELILEKLIKMESELNQIKSFLIEEKNTNELDDLLKYLPLNEIFKRNICSKPTFYAHLRKGEYSLYKFGNKSFVDRHEFFGSFKKISFGNIKRNLSS